jgi:hypothetical protein
MFGDFLPNVDEVECTDSYNEYVGAQMTFELGGETRLQGTVVKCAKGENGTPISTRNNNPILDTRRYTVWLMDRSEQEFAANPLQRTCIPRSMSMATRNYYSVKSLIINTYPASRMAQRLCQQSMDRIGKCQRPQRVLRFRFDSRTRRLHGYQ